MSIIGQDEQNSCAVGAAAGRDPREIDSPVANVRACMSCVPGVLASFTTHSHSSLVRLSKISPGSVVSSLSSIKLENTNPR